MTYILTSTGNAIKGFEVLEGVRYDDGLDVMAKVFPASEYATAIDEAEMLLRSQGDHVAIMLEFLRFDDFSVLIMERVDGMDLAKCRLRESEVYPLLSKVHEILCRLKSVNICHGDIKPSNVMYNRRMKQVTLIDFGLSSNYDTEPYCNVIEDDYAYFPTQKVNSDEFNVFALEMLKLVLWQGRLVPNIEERNLCTTVATGRNLDTWGVTMTGAATHK